MPKAAEPLISRFFGTFTRPTFNRAMVLMLGAILSLRQRTITETVRAVRPLVTGRWNDFHRVLCLRVWSNWPLGRQQRSAQNQPGRCVSKPATLRGKGLAGRFGSFIFMKEPKYDGQSTQNGGYTSNIGVAFAGLASPPDRAGTGDESGDGGPV
jgi:hypothetical protein